MARIVIPNTGEVYCLSGLRELFNRSSILRLFVNDLTLSPSNILDSFDEAGFDGYSPKDISGGWVLPILTATGEAEIVAAVQIWTKESGGPVETIYGVYCTSSPGQQLIFAQRTAEPIILGTAGQQFSYAPRFRFRNIA